MTEVHTAELEWDDEGQPISRHFGDVYFSKANGLQETRHVFLQHNQLAERWQTLPDKHYFTIAETGFGSGLNFLAAWELWLKTAPASAQLHFVSVEKFPLLKADLSRALALWPELTVFSNPLIECYPTLVGTGFHRLNFMNGRIKLTLIIDDATDGFTKLLSSTHPLFTRAGPKVDAWFLDGFAPSKNPQMWSDTLFDCIANLSHKGTTAATFSAAAVVKNGLLKAGFQIQKVPGFGRKREMVKADFRGDHLTPNAEDFTYRGSFSPYPVPWAIQGNKPDINKREAVIIGGGLAGCHTARALAERGWQVTLLEQHQGLAQEGSGNPQGALYAKLSPLDEAQAAFNLAALQYSFNSYRHLWPKIGEQCGLLQLAYKPAEAKLHEELRERFTHANELVSFVDACKASEIAGVTLDYSGLYFPTAGWINPKKLCEYLVDHPNIHIKNESQAIDLKRLGNVWSISLASGQTLQSDVVVIATAKNAMHFEQASHLPIKSIRGQVTYLPSKGLPHTGLSQIDLAQTKNTPTLNTVVCAEGYISPAIDNRFCIGATFNLKDDSEEVRASDHQTNLDNLHQHLPALASHWDNLKADNLEGRVAFRCSLPDYLPVVGPLPDVEQLIHDFAPLRKNAKAGVTLPGTYLPGLYINIGHGARGLAYTPLCAELLAAHINNEPLPVGRELANALHPARFIIRDLTRNKR